MCVIALQSVHAVREVPHELWGAAHGGTGKRRCVLGDKRHANSSSVQPPVRKHDLGQSGMCHKQCFFECNQHRADFCTASVEIRTVAFSLPGFYMISRMEPNFSAVSVGFEPLKKKLILFMRHSYLFAPRQKPRRSSRQSVAWLPASSSTR